MDDAEQSETNWPRPTVTVEEMAAKLTARCAELEARGINVDLPRNSGKNRTESKKALLKAINEAAAKKGFEW
jgi:hypothetical protein